MKRLLPAVVLTFAVSASCMLDLDGMQGAGGALATTTSTAGPGSGETASASATGAGGAQPTSSATSSSTGMGGPVWTRRRKLELDSGVAVTLNDFSILVLLRSDRIDYGQTQDQGQDLRFTDDKNKRLDHEIERWDEG